MSSALNNSKNAASISAKTSFRGKVKRGGRDYLWHQNESGEVVLCGEDKIFHSIGYFKLREDDQLQLVNALLAQFRPNAMPDENGYYAAAALVTGNGQLFLGVNDEVHNIDPFSGRGCAETSALRKSMEATHDAQVPVNKIYLMSGKAIKKSSGALEEKELGHLGCPCGECRDNLRSHTNENTKFIMLPTNDGSEILKINKSAATALDVGKCEAWEISQQKMYPLPEFITKERIAERVREGYLAITNGEMPKAMHNSLLTQYLQQAESRKSVTLSAAQMRELVQAYAHVDLSVPALQMDSGIENVNRVMVSMIKEAYREHAALLPDGKNLKITVVMLKTDEGKFYPGISVVGDGWLPSKPPAFATALSNANNHIGFTDVYMMTFDNKQILAEMSAGKEVNSHALAMPNAAALNRTLKNLFLLKDALLTVIPINSGALTGDELEKMNFKTSIVEAFGPHFNHAKAPLVRRQM